MPLIKLEWDYAEAKRIWAKMNAVLTEGDRQFMSKNDYFMDAVRDFILTKEEREEEEAQWHEAADVAMGMIAS